MKLFILNHYFVGPYKNKTFISVILLLSIVHLQYYSKIEK